TDAPGFLGGDWSTEGAPTERVGPFVRRPVSRMWTAGSETVASAVHFARTNARAIATLAPATRAQVLDAAAQLAVRHRNEFARLIALELGKPVKDGLGEMDRVADTMNVCAAEARQIGGEVLPVAG